MVTGSIPIHIIGIDPGLSGALSVLDAAGALVTLCDTPVLTVQVQRGQKQVYDAPGMVALLQPYAGQPAHVLIEEAQPMPGQGGDLDLPDWQGVRVVVGYPGRVAAPVYDHQAGDLEEGL